MVDVSAKAARLEELKALQIARHKQHGHLLLRSTFVGCRGPLSSPLLVLGEAPGEVEEEQERPFAGSSGELVETLLSEAGYSPDAALYTNVMKFRPAESRFALTGPQASNRRPSRPEVEAFSDLLAEEVRTLAPRVVLAVGGVSASWCAGEEIKITKARGDIVILKPDTPVVVTYHPSYLLYRRQEKRGRDRDDVLGDFRKALDLLR